MLCDFHVKLKFHKTWFLLVANLILKDLSFKNEKCKY